MTDFERYVAAYSPDLTRFCMKLCGNAHDAEITYRGAYSTSVCYYIPEDVITSSGDYTFVFYDESGSVLAQIEEYM